MEETEKIIREIEEYIYILAAKKEIEETYRIPLVTIGENDYAVCVTWSGGFTQKDVENENFSVKETTTIYMICAQIMCKPKNSVLWYLPYDKKNNCVIKREYIVKTPEDITAVARKMIEEMEEIGRTI